MINSLEKLEIVKERGEAANFSGASPRRRRRRNASELFSIYAANRLTAFAHGYSSMSRMS